jgi:hypothetical protein
MVVSDYQEYLKLIAPEKHPKDLLESLKGHERYPVMLDNIIAAVKIAETRLKKPLKRSSIKDTVYSVTENFIWGVEKAAEKRNASSIRKALDIQAQENEKKLHAIVDELAEDPTIDEAMLERIDDAT